MPDLNALILRSSPRVFATGRLIKGLYYSERPTGRHAMAAFHMTCDRLLEQKPFLMMDFRSNEFFLDGDRDGCVDATGRLIRRISCRLLMEPKSFAMRISSATVRSMTWPLPHLCGLARPR
jgi:hypothetical protein